MHNSDAGQRVWDLVLGLYLCVGLNFYVFHATLVEH